MSILKESVASIVEAREVKAVKYVGNAKAFCIKGGPKLIAKFIERTAKRVDSGFVIERADAKFVTISKETDLGEVYISFINHPKYPRYEIHFRNAEQSDTETNKVFDVLVKTGYGRGVGIGHYAITYVDFHKEIDENSTEADLEEALYNVLNETVEAYFKSLKKFS